MQQDYKAGKARVHGGGRTWRRPARLLPLLGACLLACRGEPVVILHPSGGPSVKIAIELAITEDEKARGLMWRRELPEDRGMLFVFASEGRRVFWMKNTPISLDIIFLDDTGRVVHIARGTVPFSTAPIPSKKPARYVLEVKGGLSQRWGLQIGDRVDLRQAGL